MNYTSKLCMVFLAFGTSAFAGEGKPAAKLSKGGELNRGAQDAQQFAQISTELRKKIEARRKIVDAAKVAPTSSEENRNELLKPLIEEHEKIRKDFKALNPEASDYDDQYLNLISQEGRFIVRFTKFADEKGLLNTQLQIKIHEMLDRVQEEYKKYGYTLEEKPQEFTPIHKSPEQLLSEQALKERNASPEFQKINEQALREMSRRRYSVASKGLAAGAIGGGLYVAAYHFGFIQGPINVKTAGAFTLGCAAAAAGCGYKAHKLKVPSSDRRVK